MSNKNKFEYKVFDKKTETKDVVTLKLQRIDNIKTSFISGQFITVFFPESGTPEGKAYSISNTSNEGTVDITVKAMGDFSNKLCKMEIGDTVIASAPYGFFYSENEDTSLIFLAIGIGITPFKSMIMQALKNNPNREIFLFYGNKTADDIIFKNDWGELTLKHKNLKIKYFISKEENLKDGFEKGRLSVNRVLESIKVTPQTEFLICGSISFVRETWKNLCTANISENNIYTEAFF